MLSPLQLPCIWPLIVRNFISLFFEYRLERFFNSAEKSFCSRLLSHWSSHSYSFTDIGLGSRVWTVTSPQTQSLSGSGPTARGPAFYCVSAALAVVGSSSTPWCFRWLGRGLL